MVFKQHFHHNNQQQKSKMMMMMLERIRTPLENRFICQNF